MVTHFYTASSLDGFIATPECSLEWLFMQDFDTDGPMAYPAFIEQIGALVMGSSTYEWLLAHQENWEYAQPTFVFTHREPPVPAGADGRIVSGDVAEVFKEEGRPLLPRSLQLELVDTARNRDFVCARYRMARRTET